MEVTVLGEGAWGCAISSLLANNGHTVKLWCYDKEVQESILKTRINHKYFKDFKLDEKIKPILELSQALNETDWIFIAIPVKFLRSVIQNSAQYIKPTSKLIILCKGIESDTLLLPTQIIDSILDFKTEKVILSGPSFAKDLAQKQITGVNLASENINLSRELKSLLDNDYFFTQIISDTIGIQIFAALKNISAIAIGMLYGAGYKDNTKAFILTQILKEISIINSFLGGKTETIRDLAGIGDLILTSYSNTSKNFQFGYKLGQGKSTQEILEQLNIPPEGINTLKSAYKIIEKNNLNLPTTKNIYYIVYDNKDLSYIFSSLSE